MCIRDSFLCIDAATLPDIFDRNEVDRIYLNFSDPWPKDRHARRRLTSSEFLARYDLFLAPDGRIEFKTDNQDPVSYTHLDVYKRQFIYSTSLYHTIIRSK